MRKPRLQRVACVSDLEATGSYGFALRLDGVSRSGFVVRWDGNVYAYINSCPHTGVELDWLPNQFFDLDQRYLQCSMHGALFEPDSGLCIHGPCLGRSLAAVAVELRGEDIYIDCAAWAQLPT
jgi:nitrite reductase/ring-hydroxylating ferredoxin subunit